MHFDFESDFFKLRHALNFTAIEDIGKNEWPQELILYKYRFVLKQNIGSKVHVLILLQVATFGE